MIGRLRGKLAAKHPPQLLIDVQGVGYEVEAPMSTIYELPAVGEAVSLHTHLVVKEDAHTLYGFASEAERRLFRALIRISGVGPKMALTLLSGMRPEEFRRCVEHEDVAQLTRLPGIGKKTAERLLLELKDKIADWLEGPNAPVMGSAPPLSGDTEIQDAVSALVALGYKPAEAGKLAQKVAEEGMPSDEIIRLALKSTLR